MFARKNIFRLAGTLTALVAGAALLASCRVPPSPPPTANGSTVPISYAFFEWKEEKDFKRISEYFTDEENLGGNCVLRTDATVRDGLYFVLALKLFEKIPAGSKATLNYFRPDKTGEQTATFELPEFSENFTNEILLGLTGDAWQKELKKQRPTAWRISVTAPDGKLLVYRESFLWKLPKE